LSEKRERALGQRRNERRKGRLFLILCGRKKFEVGKGLRPERKKRGLKRNTLQKVGRARGKRQRMEFHGER